ncbi:bifunctional aspartate kinase/homoserine dehydrogenase I [Legionella waltersii]|uniref:Bifunctional aspartokinase/homoserine dehydrogenase n=1 Tax=Legionella waltersii TaxID=66969 RepID=A0A0W1AMU4_9GAMM|nr:bifunctional aspartate kinase/homoserine dehydrogenase I [Legionella waltersii]KTD82594.1 bifunctional aspartate kinase/diaminopimelate decarboxylase protein [Legionella waltersii]SNV02636.1 aspartokinase [Legionella waltersii]
MTTVNKVGGSCLRSIENYLQVSQITSETPCILVISASYGTTQELLTCLQLASQKKLYTSKLNQIINKHLEIIKSTNKNSLLEAELIRDKNDIFALLQSISLLGSYSEQQRDWLLGYGEYWSSKIIASCMNAEWIDAGEIITIQSHQGMVNINWKETNRRLQKKLRECSSTIIVMPGFVARTTNGQRALLGFNGTDYSAAIIAKLINAEQFIKWTDVDGIYTADPKLVKSAFAISELSYQEAAELAYFGASILHPQSVQPAIEANIPIIIKNFHKLNAPGTKICKNPEISKFIIRGLSSIAHVAMINLEGSGLLGLCGAAGRLFNALARANISVILISQASSEHSISIVVKEEYGSDALNFIRDEFNDELAHDLIQNVELINQCAVVSAVGDKMSGTPGVAAKFFEMMFRANINVLAIAQGSSERNISIVIRNHHVQRALRALHGGFYLSSKTLSIGLIGPGGVGSTLIKQIKANRLRLKQEMNVDLQIRGIMNSKAMLLNDNNSDLTTWQNQLKQNPLNKNLKQFLAHIASAEIPHSVIIDCTTSSEVADEYINIIKNGCHIVTPNKKANSATMKQYKELQSCVADHNRHYLYETTVCAGLPIIKTIQELLATGDVIKRIEGVVSGTLSYIFHQCAHGASFADSVLQAYKLGYTEPDPREDLTGLDVARKFICLGRELGYENALEEVELLNLVPVSLMNGSVENFLTHLKNHQSKIEQLIQHLLKKNTAIAYVGVIQHGKISISLNGYPSSHPFANTQGTDNILLIQSKRYDKQPLIIQGPGAGKDVTAAGVFADLLKLASML